MDRSVLNVSDFSLFKSVDEQNKEIKKIQLISLEALLSFAGSLTPLFALSILMVLNRAAYNHNERVTHSTFHSGALADVWITF